MGLAWLGPQPLPTASPEWYQRCLRLPVWLQLLALLLSVSRVWLPVLAQPLLSVPLVWLPWLAQPLLLPVPRVCLPLPARPLFAPAPG